METLCDLNGVARLLDWDRETLMPLKGAVGRGEQVGTLRALRHREVLQDGIDEDLAFIEAHGDPGPAEAAMISLARHERARAERVSEDLVRAMGQAQSTALTLWLEHRERGDFASFAPALAEVVNLTRQIGESLELGAEPYDGLLDDYEPGARAAHLEAMFGELEPALTAIIDGAAETPPSVPFAGRAWPTDAQMALAEDIARLVGFDLDAGLIAQSAHPFTDSPHRGDIRFTTRIAPNDPTCNVLVTLHEAGHALYAQGLPAQHDRTLLHASASLGADESQSRFFENHIGRRAAFWEYLHPTLAKRFGSSMDGIDPAEILRNVTGVHRGWSRVDADEVTYDLHIILRFRLELALIRGSLTVADLPEAWRESSRRLLGVEPANNAEGCMQDIHWAWGMFGYFPTYTLGNIYAAQLADALEQAEGPLDDLIRSGSFDVILEFMRSRVHTVGNQLRTSELMERATGHPFRTEPFLHRIAALASNTR